MPTVNHDTLATVDMHVVGYVQAGDPGAIGAGKVWIDTSGGVGAWEIKARNAVDTGWEQDTITDLTPAHKDATTGVHGVGAGTVAEVADIAVDANLSVAAQNAVTLRHTQFTDYGVVAATRGDSTASADVSDKTVVTIADGVDAGPIALTLTNPVNGQHVVVRNNDIAQAVTINGVTIAVGTTATIWYDGAAWHSAAAHVAND